MVCVCVVCYGCVLDDDLWYVCVCGRGDDGSGCLAKSKSDPFIFFVCGTKVPGSKYSRLGLISHWAFFSSPDDQMSFLET
jgi:hypothetical protein